MVGFFIFGFLAFVGLISILLGIVFFCISVGKRKERKGLFVASIVLTVIGVIGWLPMIIAAIASSLMR